MGITAPLPQETVSPRRAIITGSDSGIGRAVAAAFAGGGLDVGITYHRDRAGAEGTAAEAEQLGAQTVVRRLDLAEIPESVEVLDDMVLELGGIDVLVNCAGTGRRQSLVDMDYATWREVVDVDLDGAFLCARNAARHMIKADHGGRIINITSVHEHHPKTGKGPYCAAKAGLGALTKVLALELAQHDITVNSVAPGEIATPMTGQDDADPRDAERPGIPAGRPGHAHEVAAVVAFLATPAASYVTGASYLVDGGMTLMGPQASSALDNGDWREVG